MISNTHEDCPDVTELPLFPPSKYFPPVESSDPDGLLAFGGKLTPEWLLDAYSHGIFPWPVYDGVLLLAWWSPNPRAVLELDDLHVPRRLWRTIRSGRFEVTCDRDFAGVIRGCATAQRRAGETWLVPPMIAVYEQLHARGDAHSIEVWHEGQLAGGTYGLALGGTFSAESMFYCVRDASKVAVVYLVNQLRRRGFQLLDIQQLTDHTARLGAREISRREYLKRLAAGLKSPVRFGDALEPLEI